MLKAPLYNTEGEKIGEIELPEEIFGVKPHKHVLWEVVRAYLLNRRVGTAKGKTRGEVRGSSRKLWPQKGLGRARHGDRKAPIFVGGGKAFPPRPRQYGYNPPKKVKKLALKMALSDRARENRVLILENAPELERPRTKQAVEMLNKLGLDGERVLIVTGALNRNLYLSTRNLPKASTKHYLETNAYDVLWAEYLVLEKETINGFKERLA